MEGKLILEPRGDGFESRGVLNPAIVKVGDEVYMYYRAIADNDMSTIGFCRLKNNEVVERWDKPIMVPEFGYEKMGVEDPRITLLEGVYYMLYTAYDGLNARVAYAVSTDLIKWEKKGLISSGLTYDAAEDIFRSSGFLNQRYRFFERMYRGIHGNEVLLWEKDAVLFPQRIDGLMAMLHRVLPGIQICYFDNFGRLNDNYWRKYLSHLQDGVVIDPEFSFESAYLGTGCPPLEIEQGWLIIYHGVQLDGSRGKVYRVGAAILNKDDPTKVVGRMQAPLFEPVNEYEIRGNVDNVVFPTGAYIEKGMIYIYYGCADKNIGVKWVRLDELLKLIL